jgi:hypothetical protein
MFGPPLTRLLARASDLLDDIDLFLIALDPLRDCDAYLAPRSCTARSRRSRRDALGRSVDRDLPGRAERAGVLRGVKPPNRQHADGDEGEQHQTLRKLECRLRLRGRQRVQRRHLRNAWKTSTNTLR